MKFEGESQPSAQEGGDGHQVPLAFFLPVYPPLLDLYEVFETSH